MEKINFTKMVASGNDFVVIDNSLKVSQKNSGGIKPSSYSSLAKRICDRKYGVGADGLLVLGKPKAAADVKMSIFNADGSEAEMCGNGARCAALYAMRYPLKAKHQITIETKAGLIGSEVNEDNVKINLTDPKGIKLDMPVRIGNRNIKLNFIDTGVPHAVIFVEGLHKFDILPLGKFIRYYEDFSPRGTNVDFVEVWGRNSIKVRTYERGVEGETLACGTGSVASALIFALKAGLTGKVYVHTQSAEILIVYFRKIIKGFENVWLEGRAKIAYEGVYYV